MVFFFTKVYVTIIMFMLISSKQLEAMRPLEGDEWLLKKDDLVIQSLQRGPVAPSGRSPCTYIGGSNTGRCPLNGRKTAGHVVAQAPPVFPGAIVEFGVAQARASTS
ncbi:hypothetical protein AQUCO_01700661v1 [Aquilegia coerulea]|uniref:Uncharacterized protein n=1 Tax=Aquilegia coerulea TaxID=218851 RepID=A0A2G5DP31_AQUCA|nr:hypothetical protein AQUCO_01700661v1 [Aquilegia coerulea]